MLGGLVLFLTTPAFAQEFMPPPIVVQPLMAPTPKIPPEVKKPQVADTHVESTELGFETGVGPAVGRTVTFHDKRYEVTDIAAVGGGPTFSGNSRFAVAPAGKRLLIGLKAVDSEKLAALQQASLRITLN